MLHAKETGISYGHFALGLCVPLPFPCQKVSKPCGIKRVLSYMGGIGMSVVKHVILIKQFCLK